MKQMKQVSFVNNGQQLAIVETNVRVLDVLMKDKDGNILAVDKSNDEFYSNNPRAINEALSRDFESTDPGSIIMSGLVRTLVKGKTIYPLKIS